MVSVALNVASVEGGSVTDMDNIHPIVSQDVPAFAKIKIICEHCNKPVDKFTYKIQGEDIKIEVECHRGYEMWRVRKDELDGGLILSAKAFRK
jgi:hypothetical protein